MSCSLSEIVSAADLNNWKMLKMASDDSPTSVHRTIWHAWQYVVRSHIQGHLPQEEYACAYWLLLRAYNSIDKEYFEQEAWAL